MIKVLVADDHPIVRQGLKQTLADTPDLEVAGEAGNAQEVLAKVGAATWDVVVMDLSMPGRSGVELIKEVKRLRPHLPVLVLSMHPEDQAAVPVLKAGASGYLTKESAPDQLVAAIRKAVAGGKYVSPSLAEKLALEVGRDTDTLPHETLSDREYQVLRLLASGKTVTEIAEELSLSVKTISTYRTRILEKMNMQTTAELMHYAISRGLVR